MIYPKEYPAIEEETRLANFNMASDPLTGSLLKTLAASKPKSRFLELGTGTGLSTSWILAGMDAQSHLISLENTDAYLAIAKNHLGNERRLDLVLADGDQWLKKNNHLSFDFIFADTWPGKYRLLDETISLLAAGGIYIVDDMLPQSNWPEGHDLKAAQLSEHLLQRNDLVVTRMDWSTGIIVGVKI